MKRKKKYLVECIIPLQMFGQVANFRRLRDMAAQRSKVVLAVMFQIRDELTTSASGLEFVNLPSLDWPGIRQPLTLNALVETIDLPSMLADTVARDEHAVSKIDHRVLIPLMRIHAEKVSPILESRLMAIIPGAKQLDGRLDHYAADDKLISVAPVKGQQRMQVRNALHPREIASVIMLARAGETQRV